MSEILYSLLLAGVFYIVILLCYKVMGKREINQLSSFDVVINILIANIAAGGIIQEEYWLDALGGVLVIVFLQIIVAKAQVKYPSFRTPIDGEPSLLIKNGRIDYNELRKLRIQLDDLMLLLRQNNVVSIEEVQYAILEANGKLSLYERKMPTKVFPLPLVVSSKVKKSALKSLGKSEEWLLSELEKNQIPNLHNIKYLFYEENKLILYTKHEMQKIKIKPS